MKRRSPSLLMNWNALMPKYCSVAKLLGVCVVAAARGAAGWLARNASSLVGFGRAGGHGQQEVAELDRRGDREEAQAVDHDVGVAAVRQVELDRHAMRVGLGIAVGEVGDAG